MLESVEEITDSTLVPIIVGITIRRPTEVEITATAIPAMGTVTTVTETIMATETATMAITAMATIMVDLTTVITINATQATITAINSVPTGMFEQVCQLRNGH